MIFSDLRLNKSLIRAGQRAGLFKKVPPTSGEDGPDEGLLSDISAGRLGRG